MIKTYIQGSIQPGNDQPCSNRIIEFDLRHSGHVESFARLISELQDRGAKWKLEQEGMEVHIILA